MECKGDLTCRVSYKGYYNEGSTVQSSTDAYTRMPIHRMFLLACLLACSPLPRGDAVQLKHVDKWRTSDSNHYLQSPADGVD